MNKKEIIDEILNNSKRFIETDALMQIFDVHNLDILAINSILDLLPNLGVVTGDNIQTVLGTKNQESHRVKNTTFAMLDIPVGAQIVYIRDSSITAKILDGKNKIQLFNGQIGSISTITQQLEMERGATDGPKQGARYWLFNGKTLWDIRQALTK